MSTSSDCEPTVAPTPRSPPKHPDFCGRRRLQLEVQILNREVGFLEQDELQALEGLPPVARCCKEVHEFVGTNPDPLVPLNKRRRRSCRFWRWLGSKLCHCFPCICCCIGCSHQCKKPSCSCCPNPKNVDCCNCHCNCLRCCCYPETPCCQMPPASCCKLPGCCWKSSCCCKLPGCCSCNLCCCWKTSCCCKLPGCCSCNPRCCKPPKCCSCQGTTCCKRPSCCCSPTISCPEYSCGCVFDCPKCNEVRLCPKCSKPCCVSGCLC